MVWHVLGSEDRPWWRRLSAQSLEQAEVRTPDGQVYWVRVTRNAPLKLGGGGSGDVDAAIGLVIENLRLMGRTGWSIRVIKPPGAVRAAREMFRQDVHAQAIVAGVAHVVLDAMRRGEHLWDEA